uniref:S-protein homolog n=1 Tax=Cicer arietinum TaxID=3827 RepID=A0A1S2Z3C9_CICAR|nr:S-protein homolog 5-like [Cicer arietinum]
MIFVSKFVLSVSLLLTIIVALQFKDGESNIFYRDKVTVYITNNLTNNVELGVYCKDKDHYFGFEPLRFGETYDFTFRPNTFIRTTLYFCGFSWGKQFHRFDIYVENRDGDCQHCLWKINASRPCKIKKDYGGSIQCFDWNNRNVVREKRHISEGNNTSNV